MATKDLESKLNELLAWKERQEQDQADRLTEMNNSIVQIFIDRHATASEVNTVLDMVKLDSLSNFIKAQKSRAEIAVKPADILPPMT